MRKPVVYAGGESEAAKTMIAARCDAYVMHGDEPQVIAEKIADITARRAAVGPSAKAGSRVGVRFGHWASASPYWSHSPRWPSAR